MNAECVPCLSEAAAAVLAPHRAVRIALLGRYEQAAQDVHLLVEFAPDAGPVRLTDWLHLQRTLRERCGCTVELISVNNLLDRIASDAVELTVLYDSAADA